MNRTDDRHPMRRIGLHDTGFQRIDVWASDREVEFRVAGATHAWWHRDRLLTGLAWDNLAASALLGPHGPPRSVLMLGLAGGTSLRTLRHLVPDIRLTAVEIDPGIVDLARKHMALDDLGLTLHLADAYEWIRSYRGPPFDVIIDDVYQALDHDVARPGAWSKALGADLVRLMRPDGLLVVNLVTGRGHRALQSDFRRFFRRTFATVRSVSTPGGMNEALVGAAAVRGASALSPWRDAFRTASDRRFWDVIAVRRL